MPSDIKCCGFNFDSQKITFWGIFTFAFPLLLINIVFFLILAVPVIFIPAAAQLHNKLKLLLKANYALINSSSNLRIRSIISGKLFSLSPWMSGLIYRYFNLAFLSIYWLAICSTVYLSFKLITHAS